MKQSDRGFTLVELIIVIVLTSIIATMVTQVITRPFAAYQDSSRRASLVNAANIAINIIAREIRSAVPNSIRVNAGENVIEFMPAVVAGRYREGIAGDPNGLTVSKNDDSFNNLGDLPDCNPCSNYRLVIYNTNPVHLYNGSNNSITPASTTVTIADCTVGTCGHSEVADLITLSAPHRFNPGSGGSPRKRFYATDGPVSFHCDPTTNFDIRRYFNYTPQAAQPTNRSAAPLSTASDDLLTDRIVGCTFTFAPGTSTYRSATVTIRLTISEQNEAVELFKEVHIWNAP